MEDSKIQVSREQALINGARAFQILINNQPKMTVLNGKVHRESLQSGAYKIQAKMGWKRSEIIEVDLNSGDQINLKVANTNGFYYFNIVKFIILFFIATWVAFGDLDNAYVLYILLISGLGSLLEYTWLKNKHLTLQQE